jgi:hypothetical protein
MIEQSSTNPANDSQSCSEAKKAIEQVWSRARSNAFAHRIAFERLEEKSHSYYRKELIFSILSILFVIFSYFILDPGLRTAGLTETLGRFFSLCFAILSVVATLFALGISVMANVRKLESAALEHNYQQGFYLYIAQKTRRAMIPHLEYHDLVSLLTEIEDEFKLMKGRGREPSDNDFKAAAKVEKTRQEDENTKKNLSYTVPRTKV